MVVVEIVGVAVVVEVVLLLLVLVVIPVVIGPVAFAVKGVVIVLVVVLFQTWRRLLLFLFGGACHWCWRLVFLMGIVAESHSQRFLKPN